MKKSLKFVLMGVLVANLIGCGMPKLLHTPTPKEYPTYGFINADTSKSAKVCYEVSIGNVIWSIILIETIVAPVYFVGFSLFDPIREKREIDDNCSSVD